MFKFLKEQADTAFVHIDHLSQVRFARFASCTLAGLVAARSLVEPR